MIDVKQGSPSTFGWLRRKDLETDGCQVWEQPDGKLHKFPPEITPKLSKAVFPKDYWKA